MAADSVYYVPRNVYGSNVTFTGISEHVLLWHQRRVGSDEPNAAHQNQVEEKSPNQ